MTFVASHAAASRWLICGLALVIATFISWLPPKTIDVCEYEQAGDTLLSLAVGAGFERVVTMLLQRGADVNWVDSKVRETITI